VPKTKSSTKKIVLVVGLIGAIILGGAGVYLFLALPGPVFSTSIDTTGVLVTETYDVTLGFPKSQMQVSLELSSTPLFWAIDVHNSTDHLIYSNILSTSPGTYTSIWFNAPPGSYRIEVGWTGTLTVRITVFARGVPFVT
jgi:hypothetical protein